jgi:hypothetical protein
MNSALFAHFVSLHCAGIFIVHARFEVNQADENYFQGRDERKGFEGMLKHKNVVRLHVGTSPSPKLARLVLRQRSELWCRRLAGGVTVRIFKSEDS